MNHKNSCPNVRFMGMLRFLFWSNHIGFNEKNLNMKVDIVEFKGSYELPMQKHLLLFKEDGRENGGMHSSESYDKIILTKTVLHFK